jgi:hypothetical protein
MEIHRIFAELPLHEALTVRRVAVAQKIIKEG